ncbi:MAG: citrate/2-methylcitrate synthase [bacterium]
MCTPIFAVSRVAGWTARMMEYLKRNRIFRRRSIYIGEFDNHYLSFAQRPDTKQGEDKNGEMQKIQKIT